MKLPRWARVVLLGILALFLVLILALAALVAYGNWRLNTYHPRFPANTPCDWHRGNGRPLTYGDIYQRHFLAWTSDGSQIIFDYGEKDIYIVDAAGTQLQTLVTVSPFEIAWYGMHADASPVGNQIVYSSCEFPTGNEYEVVEQELHSYEIVLVNPDGTGKRRLTENRDLDHYPVWSPDGSRIAFISTQLRKSTKVNYFPTYAQLFTMAADGTDVRRVARPEHRGAALLPPVWSPDGEYLAYIELALIMRRRGYEVREYVLYTARADGEDQTELSEVAPVSPSWSPDGQQVAVAKLVGSTVKLFILAADGSSEQPIADMAVKSPIEKWENPLQSRLHTLSWSPDGTHILYSCVPRVCVIDVASGRVTELVKGVERDDREWYLAAWSPDGARIAVYTHGYPSLERRNFIPSRLFTLSRDGSDRRELARQDDDGNLVPANLQQ